MAGRYLSDHRANQRSDYLDSPALSSVDCCLLRYGELWCISLVWKFDQKLVIQDGSFELVA